MKLHYFPGTIAIAAAITLEETGIAYDPVLVDFKSGAQQGAEYLGLNPKGRVPLLQTEDGDFTETGAILEYIAARAPQSGLVPTDPVAAARMRGVMYYIASTMHINHAHRLRGHRWADQQSSFDDMKAKVPATMTDCAAYVEEHCLAGPFVLGDSFSVADPYLFIACNWLEGDKVDVAPFPRIQTFRAAMEDRPSVKAVRAAGMLP